MSPGTEKLILRISEDIENISPWEDVPHWSFYFSFLLRIPEF